MAEYQESSAKFLSVSSSENRDSFFSDTEAFEGDEEFYEEIEAPKFVDFTSPDHFCPDDRYWFCHRVGCDQKHEEEMDSEAIYKKFVLRVMAARSPNIIRLRKILDRTASRKCPLSAPPKPSKPRLSKTALVSSFSKKTTDDKEKVVKPVPKPRSTPLAKSKPVAAKYLTTPRNKKCIQNDNAFRSVQNPKPINTDVPKNRVVAKALVFQSPKKKTVKVKTSVELRTPVSKLCQGMNKLEITSKLPKSLSKSRSSREINSCKVQRRPDETLSKYGKFIKSKINNGKLSQHKALMKEENQKLKQEEFELQKPKNEEKCLEQEVSDNSRFQATTTNGQDNNNNNNNGDGNENVNSSSEGERLDENEFMDGDDNNKESMNEEKRLKQEVSDNSRSQATTNGQQNNNSGDMNENVNNSSEGERDENEFIMDGDDDNKENAAAIDENRMQGENPKQNERKVLAMNDQSGPVIKKVQRRPEKTLSKSEKSIRSKINVKLSQQKALMKEENQKIKEEEFDLQKSTLEEKCLELEVSDDNSRSQATTIGQENNNSGDGNENVNNSCERERDGNEFMDGDDNNKENATAIDENRMQGENPKKNERKVLAMNDQSGHARKKVTQEEDRKLKDGLISRSSTVVKLKKPKATNPKPFRLRTDERGILKETKLERRTNHVASQNESVTLSSTALSSVKPKPQMKKQGNDNNIERGLKIPKGPGRSKPAAAAAVMPESKKHSDGNAMQRLEKFRKVSYSLQKHSTIRPQGHVSTKKELTPFLIPGQKLDVIPENSPEVLELKMAGKANADAADCAAASPSSLHGQRPITGATYALRGCTKKLK
ncbi:hypothetical protein CASFOL_042478 [Castilleja foliolosa]|uniref:Uncharacterized protein n=1 Tax=Castilleja foliolosa TaxID=1961234 RepID=A0ABD3BB77_9LAMI